MTPAAAAKKRRKFDPQAFLSTIDGGRTISSFVKKQTIFAQGDLSDAVFYIQEGRVKLTVGKETSLGSKDFGGVTTRYTRIKPIATIPWIAPV